MQRHVNKTPILLFMSGPGEIWSKQKKLSRQSVTGKGLLAPSMRGGECAKCQKHQNDNNMYRATEFVIYSWLSWWATDVRVGECSCQYAYSLLHYLLGLAQHSHWVNVQIKLVGHEAVWGCGILPKPWQICCAEVANLSIKGCSMYSGVAILKKLNRKNITLSPSLCTLHYLYVLRYEV